jgi:hypothetical protein
VCGVHVLGEEQGKLTLSTQNNVSNAVSNTLLEGSASFGNPDFTRLFMSERYNPYGPELIYLFFFDKI